MNPFITTKRDEKKATENVMKVQPKSSGNINILSESEKKRFLSKLKLEMSES